MPRAVLISVALCWEGRKWRERVMREERGRWRRGPQIALVSASMAVAAVSQVSEGDWIEDSGSESSSSSSSVEL
ncbi:hypothetical protein K402DRAFT_105418 [Aulographum hederae CBS 113979]|uniref:Uncharacterized protein n=1 Tax=Aulographum hederae CBS 113979 TaxID=1176131 RepID=A0A6G1GXI6_9PEZI|nr:hypothetical protein K402DRAFT_105418 [Aulographum hederae CBS 113979]